METIRIEKEGNGYTLYINDLSFGWGDLLDIMESLNVIMSAYLINNEDWDLIRSRYQEAR